VSSQYPRIYNFIKTMNKFSDEKPFDFAERNKALNKNIEKNSEIDLNSLKKEEFDGLNKYKNQMAGRGIFCGN